MSILKRFRKITIVTKSLESNDLNLTNKKVNAFFENMERSHLKIGNEYKNCLENLLPKAKIDVISLKTFNNNKKQQYSSEDLLIPIGGDGTLLNVSHKVKTNIPTILGINSNPIKSHGKLCGFTLKPGLEIEQSFEDLIEALDSEEYEELIRTRISVKHKRGKIEDHEDFEYPLGKNIFTKPLMKLFLEKLNLIVHLYTIFKI